MAPKIVSNEKIHSFCTKVLPEFRKVMNNLEELRQDYSANMFAMNLMELGRLQMSEIADPTDQNVIFMSQYIESLDLDDTEGGYFTVYAGGCIMGLVQINEVPMEQFSTALLVVEEFVQREL